MNDIVCVYSDVVLTELNKKQIKINCKNGFFSCNIYYLNLIQNYLAIERRKKINYLRETIIWFHCKNNYKKIYKLNHAFRYKINKENFSIYNRYIVDEKKNI